MFPVMIVADAINGYTIQPLPNVTEEPWVDNKPCWGTLRSMGGTGEGGCWRVVQAGRGGGVITYRASNTQATRV